MVIALLVCLILVQIGGLVAALVLVPRWVNDQKRQVADQLRALVESKDDQPSALAVLTDQMAILLAGRLWQQVEARLRGAAGTGAREANKEHEADVAASSPLAALAMAFLPKKAKMMLVNNPQFVGTLAGLLGKSQGSIGAPGNSQAPHNFKLEM